MLKNFDPSKTPRPKLTPEIHTLKNSSTLWDLEVGCGSGEFAIRRALQFPERRIIAIEKTRNKIKKMKEQPLPSNLWVLHTNAVWWVSHFAQEESLDCIFILYPNIYIKNKQVNMRWVNRPFMLYLLHRLKIGGMIEIRTNSLSYFKETKEKMTKNFRFMELSKDKVLEGSVFETAFERKYFLSGQGCRLLQWIRIK